MEEFIVNKMNLNNCQVFFQCCEEIRNQWLILIPELTNSGMLMVKYCKIKKQRIIRGWMSFIQHITHIKIAVEKNEQQNKW